MARKDFLARAEELEQLDMVFNGIGYVGKRVLNQDFNVSTVEITCDSDLQWNEKIETMRRELERREDAS